MCPYSVPVMWHERALSVVGSNSSMPVSCDCLPCMHGGRSAILHSRSLMVGITTLLLPPLTEPYLHLVGRCDPVFDKVLELSSLGKDDNEGLIAAVRLLLKDPTALLLPVRSELVSPW